MITLQIQINESTLARSLMTIQDLGQSLNEFIGAALESVLVTPIEDQAPMELLSIIVVKAVNNAKQLPSKAEFSLDDVCTTEDWRTLSVGERKSMGKSFRKSVEGSGIAKWDRRNSANKAIYIRN